MQELERRVDRLEADVAYLRRVVETGGPDEEVPTVGPCSRCGTGILVGQGGEIRCTVCGYARFL